MKKLLTIATRESRLALWQANYVKQQLLALFPETRIELLPMKTTGDKFLKDKLQSIGGKGLFVKELEHAMLDGRADIAVHSMKDVPATFPEGLQIGAILARHAHSDALLSHDTKLTIETLPPKARIGTSSLRREAQIRRLRPDAHIAPLRGNIHTRIEKLNRGDYDAIILATSGLERMSLDHLISERLDSTKMLPSCGQGALGIECRSSDHEVQKMIGRLQCPTTTLCVQTERQVNAQLGGSCHVPIAIFCEVISDNTLCLKAKIFSIDGQICIEFQQSDTTSQAKQLANRCVASLKEQGAMALINQATQS